MALSRKIVVVATLQFLDNQSNVWKYHLHNVVQFYWRKTMHHLDVRAFFPYISQAE